MLGGKMTRNCWRAVAVSVVLVLLVCLAWAADSPGGRVFRTPQPPAEARLGDIWVNPKDSAEMVYVPAGEFLMGSSEADIAALLKADPQAKAEWFADQQPQFRATLPGYWIDKCEVTVAQYRNFCRKTGREMPPAPPWRWRDDHPMVYVTWRDAAAYAQWAGERLPTELEWEKAARGTDGRTYPWGNQWPPPAGSGNFADEALKRGQPDIARLLTAAGFPPLSGYDDGYADTAPVGKFPAGASPYGALDMAGNVWEWCADWYDRGAYSRYKGGDLTPPAVAGSYRVLRGGSWLNDLNVAFQCAYRYNVPTNRHDDNGFRCARTL